MEKNINLTNVDKNTHSYINQLYKIEECYYIHVYLPHSILRKKSHQYDYLQNKSLYFFSKIKMIIHRCIETNNNCDDTNYLIHLKNKIFLMKYKCFSRENDEKRKQSNDLKILLMIELITSLIEIIYKLVHHLENQKENENRNSVLKKLISYFKIMVGMKHKIIQTQYVI